MSRHARLAGPGRDGQVGGARGRRAVGAGGVPADLSWRDRRLWAVQVAVLVLYVARLWVEVEVTRAHAPVPGTADFSTLGLFLWPVLYAAVTVGPTGAAVTTAWVALLSIPRDLAYVRGGDPIGVWAESTQVAALCLVAVVVGWRVAAERAASERADEARRAHLAAEVRYRALFDASESPTVLVDHLGTVVESNEAAATLTGRRPATLAEVVGTEVAGQLLAAAAGPDRAGERLLPPSAAVAGAGAPGGARAVVVADRRFRLTATGLPDPGIGPAGGYLQVVLTDVTAESRRRESAEAFAQAVVEAQEEERRHLAQELHDGPLQSLVHLVRQLGDGAGPESGGELRALGMGLVDELRRIARGLRPSLLDDLGLVAAIRRLLDDVAERSGIDTSVGVTGTERRLPAAVELAVYRIAQEAVTNAERHGAPARLAVGIAFEDRRLRLLVTDDGRGFDARSTARGQRPGSLGLAGMGERLHLAGGSLTVHSAPGAGTTVEAVVPLQPAGLATP